MPSSLIDQLISGLGAPLLEWYQCRDDVENVCLDLNLKENCEAVTHRAHEVYNLAANMGGMGFVEPSEASCMLGVLINTPMLQQQ
jgi:GDP-D-mannose 3', 5'-epimerase